jgi:hypothetical protein
MDAEILSACENKDTESAVRAAREAIANFHSGGKFEPSLLFKDCGLQKPFGYTQHGVSVLPLLFFFDQLLLPIPPIKKKSDFEKRTLDVDTLTALVDRKRIIPMLTGPHSHYVGINFLDPILESAPSGAIRSQMMLKAMVGDDAYQSFRRHALLLFRDRLSPQEYHRFEEEYKGGRQMLETTAASWYVEFACLGYQRLGEQFSRIASADAEMALQSMRFLAMLLTVPVVSGFGGFYNVESRLAREGLAPVKSTGSLPLVETGQMLTDEYAITVVEEAPIEDIEELYRSTPAMQLRMSLARIDAAARSSETERVAQLLSSLEGELTSFSEVVSSLRDTRSSIASISLGKIGNPDDPASARLFELGLLPIPVMSWRRSDEDASWIPVGKVIVKPAIVQPGMSLRHPEGKPGTLGAFGLTEDGRITIIAAPHTVSNLWKAKLGDPLLLEPLKPRSEPGRDRIASSVIFYPRYVGLEEDLPAVLKCPIRPQVGMSVVKSGWKTGVTRGEIIELDVRRTVIYRDATARSFAGLIGVRIGCEPGDSGSVLLSYPEYLPLGLLEAADEKNPEIAYFHELIALCAESGTRGIFCPISIPVSSSPLFRAVVGSLVPDGLFEQKSSLAYSDPGGIMEILGVSDAGGASLPDTSPVHRARLDSGVKLGDTVVMAESGRLLMNEKGEPVGIVHAHARDDQGINHFISMPIKRIESALNLELLRFDQWR